MLIRTIGRDRFLNERIGLVKVRDVARQTHVSDCRRHIDMLLSTMDERELTIIAATADGLKKARETVEV